jgi:hypothetical protein
VRGLIQHRCNRVGFSRSENFVPNVVKTDDFGAFCFLSKMTSHGVLNHCAQIIPIFALCKNTVAERTRPKAAFIGLAHFKNNLAHVLNLAYKIDFDKCICENKMPSAQTRPRLDSPRKKFDGEIVEAKVIDDAVTLDNHQE